jgi:ATP-dependent DNA helicase RecG
MGAPSQIRLYDDHFSVWNDGGLPEGITEEDLKKLHRSKPRNPLIADTCFKAGYIDSWGRGTIKIIEACLEAGLPEPILKEDQGGFLSKIFKDRFTEDQLRKMGLNDRQIEAVKYVKKNGKITNKEYQGNLKVSRITATRDLTELVAKNILRSSETKGAGSYYVLAIAS